MPTDRLRQRAHKSGALEGFVFITLQGFELSGGHLQSYGQDAQMDAPGLAGGTQHLSGGLWPQS